VRQPLAPFILGLVLICVDAQAAHAVDCKIDAVDAFGAAQQNGFEFAEMNSTASSCDLTNSTLTVSSPTERASKCVYRLFGGRSLAAPWRLTRLQVSGQGFAVSAVPPVPTPGVDASGQPRTVLVPQEGRLLTVIVPAGQTYSVSVGKVVISGPDCKHAAAAFQ
jgi:hypothetical protein